MSSTRKQMIRTLASLCLVVTFAMSGAAADLPSKYEEWRNGPVQWIMTPEEQRAWRAVSSEDEAIRFIDLFWARRDPTPGTPTNEFRAEFDGRVKGSDEEYGEGRKRGAMSDRGRVFIVLGSPTFANIEASKSTREAVGGAGDFASGSRTLGARYIWLWEREDARKFGMPRIEVVFIETVGAQRTIYRDPLRPDFLRAAPAAIRKTVVDPTLTEAPVWAPRGGLEPVILAFLVQTPAPTNVAELEEPVPDAVPLPTASVVPIAPASPEPLPVKAIDSGATRLTLVRDVDSIVTETKIDPFLNMKPVNVFHPQDELGWVAQFCSGKLEAPTLTFTVRLTGNAKGRMITLSAPPDELVPDRIRALPGCYLLRAAIPLDGMAAGSYQLEVKVENPDKGKSDTLKKEFTIE